MTVYEAYPHACDPGCGYNEEYEELDELEEEVREEERAKSYGEDVE
jgi:hypothetical protein